MGGAREMAQWLTALLEDLISASKSGGSQTPLTSRSLTKSPLFQRKHTPSNKDEFCYINTTKGLKLKNSKCKLKTQVCI